MVAAETRQRYVDEIRANAGTTTEKLLAAFANVPREEFVGPAPWTTFARRAAGQMQPQIAQVTDPADLYRDIAVLLDPVRNLTNGNPGTLAPWLDALGLSEGNSVFHLGCGTGYYTAIMAEVVGPLGSVTAAEVDVALAGQARENLARYPQVQVVATDGSSVEIGPCDAVLVNAGVTHPAANWVANLNVPGTLVVPLTVEFGKPGIGKGFVLRITRREAGYAARFFAPPVMIYSCTSLRDARAESLLGKSFSSGTLDAVQSLRCDEHDAEATCWLHAPGFCLSTSPLA